MDDDFGDGGVEGVLEEVPIVGGRQDGGLVQVTFIASTYAMGERQPDELLMFGSCEALGRGDVPHRMRRMASSAIKAKQQFLWEVTLEMNTNQAPLGRGNLHEETDSSLTTIWHVAYSRQTPILKEDQATGRKITAPLRQRYVQLVGERTDIKIDPRALAQIEEGREATTRVLFDHVLWDFERGAVRHAPDASPIQTPAMFIESVWSIAKDVGSAKFTSHVLSTMCKKKSNHMEYGHLEPGEAFSRYLDYAHVPERNHVLAMAAVFFLAVDNAHKHGRNRGFFGHDSVYSGDFGSSMGARMGLPMSVHFEQEKVDHRTKVSHLSQWLIRCAQLATDTELREEILGPHYRFCINGLRTAAETVYEELCSFQWFRLLPMLRSKGNSGIQPRVLSSFITHPQASKTILKNYDQLLQRCMRDTKVDDGWDRFIDDNSKKGAAKKDKTLSQQEHVDERKMLLARKTLLLALVDFCPTVEYLNQLLKYVSVWEEPNFSNSHPVMNRIRSHYVENHEFHANRELYSFKALLDQYSVLFYGDNEDSGIDAANVMAEAIMKNNNLIKHSRGMNFLTIQMLEFALGDRHPEQKTVSQMARWLKTHFAKDVGPSEEDRMHQVDFVATRLSSALSAWEAMVSLSCFKDKTDNLVLLDLQRRWFFDSVTPRVVLQAVLSIERGREFPRTKVMRDKIQQIICRILMQAFHEGESFAHIIDMCITTKTDFRYNVVYGLFQSKIQLVETVFTHPNLLPLKHVLAHAHTLGTVIQWVKGSSTPCTNSTEASSKLEKFIVSVSALLSQLNDDLVAKTITLGHLNDMVTSLGAEGCTNHESVLHLWGIIANVDRRAELADAEAALRQFDKELREFSTYAKMYCVGSRIEVSKLDKFVNDLRERYDSTPLKTVVGSFDKEPALKHVSWLYSLRESSLFAGLWGDAATEIRKEVPEIDQEICVARVIPRAKQLWIELEEKLRMQTCSFPDCLKMFGALERKQFLTDEQVVMEVQLLNASTPAIFQDKWCPTMIENVHGIHRLERLTLLVPSLINVHKYLKELLFPSTATDALLEKLKSADKILQTVGQWTLQDVIPKTKSLLPLLDLIDYERQDYLITLVKREDLITFLIRKEHQMVNAFKTRLRLVRQCTDDDRLLQCLLQLTEVRSTLDELLYAGTYNNLQAFLDKVKTTNLTATQLRSLCAVLASLDPLLDLLDRNTENPGVKACKEVKRICAEGSFILTGTSIENQQLTCQVRNGEMYKFESLVEMRKLLLITDVPEEEITSGETLKETVHQFVEKLKVLEDLRQQVAQLHHAGHFRYADSVAFEASPSESVDFFKTKLAEFEREYRDWRQVESDLRQKYYFFNFFLLHQLRNLRDSFLEMQKKDGRDMWAEQFEGLTAHIAGPATDITGVKERLHTACMKLKEDAEPKEQMEQLAIILNDTYKDVVPKLRQVNIIEKSGASHKEHQGSLAMALSCKGDQSVPVFCCSTPNGDLQVLDMLLSIYFRRDRLPQPDELLLCNESTTHEEVELLFRRFITASAYHRSDNIFCVANVQQLSYTTQCTAVETLRTLLSNGDISKAALLVFISGDANQVLMTSSVTTCRAQMLSIPVINKKDLRATLRNSCPNVSAIISDINGGGKTAEILIQAFEIQEKLKEQKNTEKSPVVYHHVSLRENTTSEDFVAQLLAAPDEGLIHIDVAHVVPRKMNSLLFDVLCVGTISDPKTVRVFSRKAQSVFFVEVPNTPNDVMSESLSLIQFIPTKALEMKPERILFELPKLGLDGIVTKEENVAILNTVRWIRAIQGGRFKLTDYSQEEFKDTWDTEVLMKEPVTQKEAWDILVDRCCDDTGEQPPSFLLFSNFSRFMHSQFQRVLNYKLLGMHLVKIFKINLRHVFCRMLVETTQGFSLRQVPKVKICIEGIWDDALRDCSAQSRSSPRSANLRRAGSGASALERQRSGNVEALMRSDSAAAQEAGAAGRVKAENYINRFNQMSSWEATDHPVTLFPLDENMNVKGIDLIALNQEAIIARYMDEGHARFLEGNQVRLSKDWTKVATEEAIQVIRKCRGLPELPPDSPMMQQMTHGRTKYVVTIDNLLKMMSILLRLEYGLPVIMMGETGCGKTALVQFIAEALEFPMRVLDVHGGITDGEVISFIHECIEEAKDLQPQQYLVAFLDEINAGNVMGICKSIIADRILEGRAIPDTVRIVACCNPYRMRKNIEDEEMALVYQHHSLDGGVVSATNPMRNVVYRVHQLPESLIDLVSDFGAISTKTEELYIRAILFRELEDTFDVDWFSDFVEIFARLILCSQEYTRMVNNNERSVVSLRDIARSTLVFHWFVDKYPKIEGDMSVQDIYRTAAILTLAYCYHSRLNRVKRSGYFEKLSETWKVFIDPNTPYEGEDRVTWLNFSSAQLLADDTHAFQLKFVDKMILGEGIALNEALRENLFMLLVSVMNQIPIFVIGKPGCSKSLAVEILQRNLNGVASEEPLFKSMPALQVMAYQCSPLSTASGLLNQFNNARKYAGQDMSTTIVCVLLDEVGLAEESPHLPLKVLHKELEQLDGISCIGISNWALDAAKMSRAVTLFRPPPTVDDLCKTAKDMVSSHVVRAYLRALSEGFFTVYQHQKRPDFWGLREFYSIVRVINSQLKRKQKAAGKDATTVPTLDANALMNTVLRNFGGRTQMEMDEIIDVFFMQCGMRKEEARKLSVRELIESNLQEPDARHLMLLTQNNSALRLLFDASIADWDTTEVLFGSSFPEDESDMSVATNLNKIKSWMNRPMCLILVQCDSLYESLYDLLNQHYIEFAGQRYVRIAHGSSSKECPVHHLFRIIVIVEKWDAWTTLAPPLLNRFEKQIFVRSAMLEVDMHHQLLEVLTQYFGALMSDYSEGEVEAKESGFVDKAQNIIVGYHADLLPSLVVSLDITDGRSREELLGDAMRRLIWVMPPECVTAIAGKTGTLRLHKYSNTANPRWPSLYNEYFKVQAHEDLRSFAEYVHDDDSMRTDARGGQYVVITHTPIGVNLVGSMSTLSSNPRVAHAVLHDFKSGADFENFVRQFYADPCDNGILLVQADVWASPIRQLEFCRYTCERLRVDWMHQQESTSQSNSRKTVLVVVHLLRGAHQRFNFEFDRRWRTVFIDSVTGASMLGLPSLNEMLHQPLGKVMKKVDLRQVLASHVLRPALAQLVYPTKRRSGDLSEQIKVMLEYINNDDFLQCLSSILLTVFDNFDVAMAKDLEKKKQKAKDAEETISESQYEWHVIAQTPERMQRAGTFRAALHGRLLEIMQAMMARLLAWFDRNGQLTLFGLGGPTQKAWLHMAHYSVLSSTIKESLLGCLSMDDPHALQEVITDSLSDPFTAKFPFSFTIATRIAELRVELGSGSDEGTNFAVAPEILNRLAVQWKVSQIPIDPHFETNGLNQEDYMSDFVMMRLEKSTLSLDEQKRVMFALCRKSLHLEPNEPLRSIFDVHVTFWLNQKRIFNVNHVLSAVPSALESVIEKIIQYTGTPDTCLDVLMMNQIIHAHMANLLSITDELDPEELTTRLDQWCSEARVVNFMCSPLLATKAPTDVRSELESELEYLHESMYPVIVLAYQLIRHLIQPLRLPIAAAHSILETMSPKVRSMETCGVLLDAFTKIISTVPSAKTEELLGAFGFIFEWFVLHLCIPDIATLNTREHDLLRLLVRSCGGSIWAKQSDMIVARAAPAKKEYIMSFCELGSHKVPKTESFMLSLLRKLLVPSQVTPLIEKELGTLLVRQQQSHKHGDIPLMQLLILVHEHGLLKTRPNLGEQWMSMIGDIDLTRVYKKVGLEEKALHLATIRRALGEYAEIMRTMYITEDTDGLVSATNSDGVDHNETFMKLVAEWLTTKEGLPIRSMRLLVLKHLFHLGGHTELQNALSRPPLATVSWVEQWRTEHDTAFDRFIGASVLPKWDPFADIDSYKTASAEALSRFINSNGNDVAALDNFATRMANSSDDSLHAGFVMALSSEAGLQYALPLRAAWLPKLHDWIKNATSLVLPPESRRMLRIFAGDSDWIKSNKHMKNFVMDTGISGEKIFQYRFLTHIYAACLGADKHSPLRMLHTWLFHPEKLAGTWCVCADQDLREIFQKILEQKEGYTLTESRFYTCPNGHQYAIGNCGRAFETGTCPECGAVIGGGGHQSAEGNVRMDRGDKSPPGYTFTAVKEQSDTEMYDQRRDLPPQSYRCLRLMLHAVMYCGVASGIDDAASSNRAPARYEHLFTQTHTHLRGQEDEWFADQFNADWKYMKQLLRQNVEEMTKVLHDILTQLMTTKAPAYSNSTFFDITTRNNYETYMQDTHFAHIFTPEAMVAKLLDLNKRWRSVEGPFMQELAQTADVDAFLTEDRNRNEPLLWCYYQHFDFAVLSQSLYSTQKYEKLYPVLSTLVRDYQKFESMKELCGLVDLQHLLSQKFSRTLGKEQARKLSFKSIHAELRPSERLRWKNAFDSWTRAWNSGMSTWIKNWECLELPPEYRQIRMDEDISLSFLLPGREDEGICSLVLIESVAEAHNSFMEVVQRACGEKLHIKGSHVIDQKDALTYDIDQLLNYCCESAVSPQPTGGVNCDLHAVERHLRSIFSKKPLIKPEIKMFAFRDAEEVSIAVLSCKLPQVPLSRQVSEQLKVELRDKRVLGELQTCLKTTIGFLSRTLVHALDADETMLLRNYWRNVLAAPQDLPSHTVQTHIKLCHLEALWQLMEKSEVDDFECVLEGYKAPLSEAQKDDVEFFAYSVDPVNLTEFLSSLKAYIMRFLTREERKRTDVLKIWLGAMPNNNGDTIAEAQWYEDFFPEELTHATAVNTYLVLKDVMAVLTTKDEDDSRDVQSDDLADAV